MTRPRTTFTGRLARLGFRDLDRSGAALRRLGPAADELVHLVATAADPDQAVDVLADLADRVEDRAALLHALVDDEGTAMRLLSVLGASIALGEHLLRHPGHWADLTDPALGATRPPAFVLRASLLEAVGADPASTSPVSPMPDAEAVDALRVEYRRLLLRLAARDLSHGVPVDDVAAELSDLAAGTLEAALAIARGRVGEDSHAARLAVIAMGKCGGHELNYVSDVDVIFAVEPAQGYDEHVAVRIGTQLASNLMRICSDHTAEGTIWPVDAALRPEGKAGPLVRTLASHQSYYEKWAKTWEFQALLKARPVAGDPGVGAAYIERITPLVWSAADRDGFVSEVQAMRRRVLEHIPAQQVARQIKLGSGGLRDVEFAVQLLQLVHGRADEAIRAPATLSALAELTRGGYVGREDGASLDAAYRFLRTLEHRMQLHQLRRTHVVPEDESQLRRLGRSMGLMREPVGELNVRWRRHSVEVRRLHEKLFYRPLLEAVAALPRAHARLSPEAAEVRLAALGYEDPVAALRHLEALTAGVSRTAAIQRTLLPAMLQWFADAPNPDAGLLGFRQISEALGTTHWYLQTLRDEGQVAQRLAVVLASSRYATDLLQRAPEGVRMLGEDDGLVPRAREALEKEMLSAGLRYPDPEEGITAVRAIRRRELFRIAVADLLDLLDVADVGYALTDVTTATLEAALHVARASVERQRHRPLPMRMAIVAMGRFGGHELGFGSDADVMFVMDPVEDARGEEASRAAQEVANELRRLLALPGTDPALEVDAGLRPEGKQGPLVRSLASYEAYYAKWSAVWEAQALLRACPMIGDRDLCARFTAMIDPLRFPRTASARTTYARSAASRRASTTSGSRGEPIRRPTSSSAGVASPTWSGRSSCCRCSTPARCPGCAPPARSTPSPPRWTRACSTRPTPTRWPRRGAPPAACATRSSRFAAGARTRCPATPASAPRWRTSAATRPATPTSWSTTTYGSPVAPGRWWSASSGDSRFLTLRSGVDATLGGVSLLLHVAPRRRVSTRGLVAGLLAAVVLVRLCYLGGTLYPDEAGYLLVARSWHLGGPNLYGFLFVDRPPGLLALFKLAALVPWDRAIRVLTIPFALVFVLSAVGAVRQLVGERGARWAAVLAAGLVVSPAVGAQEADGELFAMSLVMLAVALTIAAVRRTGRAALATAFGAGLVAALAVIVKQNFLDAFVFAACLLLASAVQHRLPPGRVLGLAAAGVLGGAVVLAGAAGYAVASGVGLRRAWFSIYGFRGSALDVLTHSSLQAPLGRAGHLLLLAVLAGIVPILALLAREAWRCHLTGPPVAWAVALTVGYGVTSVVAGGSYWPHYLLQLVPMTVLAVGLWAPQLSWLRLVAAAAVVSAVGFAGAGAVAHAVNRPTDGYLAGAWVRRAARPGDTLTVLYGNAQVQEAAGLPSPYPHLWSLPMRTLDPHLARLRSLLAGAHRPDWVVVWVGLDSWDLDPRDTTRLDLATRYRPVGKVCGHQVWLRRDEQRTLPPVPAC